MLFDLSISMSENESKVKFNDTHESDNLRLQIVLKRDELRIHYNNVGEGKIMARYVIAIA
jgi:hypothetical protein